MGGRAPAEAAAAYFYAMSCAAARCPTLLPFTAVAALLQRQLHHLTARFSPELHCLTSLPSLPRLPSCCSMSAVVGYAGGRTPSQADGKVCYYSGPRGSGESAVCGKSAAAAAFVVIWGPGEATSCCFLQRPPRIG